MLYRYDMHCHSSDCSGCARTPAKDMVHKYKESGYAGLVLTDHFIFGNSAVDKTLPWEERMKCYYDAYLAAKEEGDKIDFDVIFGIEHAYDSGKEMLCYGIDLKFLTDNPDIPEITIDEFARRLHKAGGILIQAHPYRERSYIDPNVEPRVDLIDGIEVYNAGNKPHENAKAIALSKEHGGIIISGGDYHGWPGEPTNRAGIALPYRVKTSEELITALKRGDHRFVVKNEVVEEITEDLF